MEIIRRCVQTVGWKRHPLVELAEQEIQRTAGRGVVENGFVLLLNIIRATE